MRNLTIYKMIPNLQQDLKQIKELKQEIALSNNPNSVKINGIMYVDYCFKYIKQALPHIVAKVIINVGNSRPALVGAIKLGYKNIVHTQPSDQAELLIKQIQ